jgi:hypothetical protein
MRRTRWNPSGGAIRWLYEWIVELYARYVLILCSRFTNDRAAAQDIAACTLATTCLLSGELEHVGQLSLLADTMADVVGRDIIRAGAHPADSCRAAGGPLLADESMQELAAGLNRLDRFTREVLVLHYVEGMKLHTLARLLRRSPAQVSAALRAGEDTLAAHLAGTKVVGDELPRPDVRSLLAALAASLDVGFARPIGKWAFRYLLAAGSCLWGERPIPCNGLKKCVSRQPFPEGGLKNLP